MNRPFLLCVFLARGYSFLCVWTVAFVVVLSWCCRILWRAEAAPGRLPSVVEDSVFLLCPCHCLRWSAFFWGAALSYGRVGPVGNVEFDKPKSWDGGSFSQYTSADRDNAGSISKETADGRSSGEILIEVGAGRSAEKSLDKTGFFQ